MTWPNNPRPAKSIIVLGNETDAAFLNRDKSSEGMLGDPRHQAEGSSSDHNPWVKDHNNIGVVRARDIDSGPGLNPDEAHDNIGDIVAEAGLAGLRTHFGIFKIFKKKFAPMGPGAYVIHEHQIASHTTKGKLIPYRGSDPHTSHPHFSVARAQSGYDSTASWNISKFKATFESFTKPGKTPVTLTRANARLHPVMVRYLQRLLKRAGMGGVTIDGKFGAGTARALALYKKNNHLKGGGWYCGPSAWKSLKGH